MTGQRCPLFVEPILKELVDQQFVIGESGNAVADITWSRYVELSADPTSAAAVVRNGDDCSDVDGVVLETAKERGETGPAANRDNTQFRTALPKSMLGDDFDQALSAGGPLHQRTDHRMAETPKRVGQ